MVALEKTVVALGRHLSNTLNQLVGLGDGLIRF